MGDINVSVQMEAISDAQAVTDEHKTHVSVNHELTPPTALDVPPVPQNQLPPSPVLGAGNYGSDVMLQLNVHFIADRTQRLV